MYQNKLTCKNENFCFPITHWALLDRLDERKRRKDFILERNLLYPDPFEKSFTPEEWEICQRYRVFMRYHLKEEHDELLKNIIEEQRIVKRIQDLQVDASLTLDSQYALFTSFGSRFSFPRVCWENLNLGLPYPHPLSP